MYRQFATCSLATVAMAALAWPVAADTAPTSVPCAKRDTITHGLEQKFGEARRGAGLVSEKSVLELWGSSDTGTWTVLMTRADGVSCIVAAGDDWRDVPIQAAQPGEPS